jgi:outer membrane protein assembly factor BamD (BamD/ComL family)
VLILDPEGVERYRIEGYLPNKEFLAHLEMGLARVAFMNKKWDEAAERYDKIAEKYPDTSVAPEAIYWRSVSQYKATNDHAHLGRVATELQQKYKDSLWAKKASVWLH